MIEIYYNKLVRKLLVLGAVPPSFCAGGVHGFVALIVAGVVFFHKNASGSVFLSISDRRHLCQRNIKFCVPLFIRVFVVYNRKQYISYHCIFIGGNKYGEQSGSQKTYIFRYSAQENGRYPLQVTAHPSHCRQKKREAVPAEYKRQAKPAFRWSRFAENRYETR